MHTMIHNVKKIELHDIKELKGGTFTRDLILHDEDGHKFEITAFGNFEDLMITIVKEDD